MARGQVLALLAKAGPQVAKQLPKLWPLLLESRNRERLAQVAADLAAASPTRRLRARLELTATLAEEVASDASDLADASPTRRLRARLDLTAALAEDVASDASTDEDRRRAQEWSVRARNLDRKMNMPVAGRAAKAEHRRSIKDQLAALQQEMNEHLDWSG